MRTLKLTLAYDGTDYVGWQRQQNGVSVQELLESAFAPLMSRAKDRPAASRARDAVTIPGRGPTVAGASRTDGCARSAGGQRDVDSARRRGHHAGLNVRLPADIRVLDVVDVKPLPRAHHALSKTYRYRW
jgi:tRNA pseudouridine38-40 synthase